MKRKLFLGIIGGIIGLIVGVFVGAYLGLVVGGTFLGGLEIYSRIGIEGYELASYIGAIIGALVATTFGVKHALRSADKSEKKI